MPNRIDERAEQKDDRSLFWHLMTFILQFEFGDFVTDSQCVQDPAFHLCVPMPLVPAVLVWTIASSSG